MTTIIEALRPLESEERHRTVDAAMTYLGEKSKPATKSQAGGADTDDDAGDGNYPAGVAKWMRQNAVSAEALDQVYDFRDNGTFEIHDAPGNSNKEKTLNAYTLVGVGNYLSTNARSFDDATARAVCKRLGCLDEANHASTLKSKHPEFSGDKKSGFMITNVGVKRAAELVKEVAGGGK